MKFALTNDPSIQSYQIEITGLPPGTNAKMAVSAKTSAGTGPAADLPLVVAPAAAVVPGAPAIVAVDDAAADETPPAPGTQAIDEPAPETEDAAPQA